MKRLVLSLTSLLFLSSVHANSVDEQNIQSLESIRQNVESFILNSQDSDEDLEVAVKALDRRLRLAKCDAQLDISLRNRNQKLGRVTVQVACTAPKPWRIYVQATVTMQEMVWTLVRGVRRGDILSSELLDRLEVTLGSGNTIFSSLATPIVDIEPWIGFAFDQNVNAGKVLNERMLKPPKLLRKGDAVVIRHRVRGLELKTRGVALDDAGARQQTQVRNTSSGKVIDVVVVSAGVVEILH